MAIDSSFDYANLLSLNKAKLKNRLRLNYLGSKELVFEYNKISNSIKEDAIEWLEANRLSLTDPKFGFRTYEGTWYCIDINYIDERSVISQRFKIDSSMGNLDGSSGTMTGTGDLASISAGTEVERAYYWRVVDPESVELPSSSPDGTVYAKTAVDNGDGTYDVTITKEVSNNLTSTSKVISDGFEETTEISTNNSEQSFVSDGGSITDPVDGEIKTIQNVPLDNGKFRTTVTTRETNNLEATSSVQAGDDSTADNPGGYRETIDVNTSSTELSFVSDGGTVADATVGEIKRIDNVPLDNGEFRTTVTTRTAIAQRIPPDFEAGGPDYPWIEYGSDYIQDANAIIIGRNRTWDQFKTDRDRTQTSPAVFKINSISARVNDYGLYDYTIISNYPG